MSELPYFTIDRDELTGGMQLSINDDSGGYRLCGPKYCGMSKTLKKHFIDERDIREIRAYLNKASRHLKATSSSSDVGAAPTQDTEGGK